MRDGAQNGKFNPLRLLLPRIRSPRCKIPETIVIKFVVRPQSWKRSCTHAVSEEDLSRCVNPCWTFLHVGPINLKKFRCRTCSFIFVDCMRFLCVTQFQQGRYFWMWMAYKLKSLAAESIWTTPTRRDFWRV